MFNIIANTYSKLHQCSIGMSNRYRTTSQSLRPRHPTAPDGRQRLAMARALTSREPFREGRKGRKRRRRSNKNSGLQRPVRPSVAQPNELAISSEILSLLTCMHSLGKSLLNPMRKLLGLGSYEELAEHTPFPPSLEIFWLFIKDNIVLFS